MTTRNKFEGYIKPFEGSDTEAFLVITNEGGRGFFSSKEAFEEFEKETKREVDKLILDWFLKEM